MPGEFSGGLASKGKAKLHVAFGVIREGLRNPPEAPQTEISRSTTECDGPKRVSG